MNDEIIKTPEEIEAEEARKAAEGTSTEEAAPEVAPAEEEAAA